MKKTILGLDLGTTSIGWALITEEDQPGNGEIIDCGVRVIPLTTDEISNFQKGKAITTNQDRTLKRSMRRSLQRFKLRREKLIEKLKEIGFIKDDDRLFETGKQSTFETLALRAAAVERKIEKIELARVLLAINAKRGYKSSRKNKSSEEGSAIDGMEVAKLLAKRKVTPGQYMLELLQQGVKKRPDFYPSDLNQEFDLIWNFQQSHYPEVLTTAMYELTTNKTGSQFSAIFKAKMELFTADNKEKGLAKKMKAYTWRSEATEKQLSIEEVLYVLAEIRSEASKASGYLGAISDRSKSLIMDDLTVGQFQFRQLQENPNKPLRGQVFYRQDYEREFDAIWKQQQKHYPDLTEKLRHEIKDEIIFYQRRLKSQKHLVGLCEWASVPQKIVKNGQEREIMVGPKAAPISSPVFQEFRLWKTINNIRVKSKDDDADVSLDQEQRERLFEALQLTDKMTDSQLLKCLFPKGKNLNINYKQIEGNRTRAAIFEAFNEIIEVSGHEAFDLNSPISQTITEMGTIFKGLGIETKLLRFDSTLSGKELEAQPYYQLWHLLYSYEGDDSVSGDEALWTKLEEKYGFSTEYARILAQVQFEPEFARLSSRVMRRALPWLKEGFHEADAAEKAGYNHSKSLTAEERDARKLKDRLDILPKGYLRNPVVEKILNQLVHVVNGIKDQYPNLDIQEVRLEMARELKKSAKERADLESRINQANQDHEKIRKILKELGFHSVSKKDIVKYKLYEELKSNGYKTLYSETKIELNKLIGSDKSFNIEHILPQALIFDDSFSNKTIETFDENRLKGSKTALDHMVLKGEERLSDFEKRVKDLYDGGNISYTKYKKLLMKQSDIQEGFINRDLRDTQYIVKMAKGLLEKSFRLVNTTTGSITDRLRQDWQLVDVMKEINFPKYEKQGLVYTEVNSDGKPIKRIKDWTKRNDHRHHVMDAITVAFTRPSHVQYLNYLNARRDGEHKLHGNIIEIEKKELEPRKDGGSYKFKPPMPMDKLRNQVKNKLENVLVSFKAKNKVVTPKNHKIKGTSKIQKTLTPRGQLHLETVYGKITQFEELELKIGSACTHEILALVKNKNEREALIMRLEEFDNDPKKAFTGKNAPDKNPIYLDASKQELISDKIILRKPIEVYTIRKPISPDIKLDKVIDDGVRQKLQQRLDEFGGDPKKAFVNLDENPIWMNREKGIAIKSVKITGVSNAQALHDKKDQSGNKLLNKEGKAIPVDFVNTGNNHHVAIYIDQEGNLQDRITSFFDAVERKQQGLAVIDKNYNADIGWKFLFSMKQNEYFVFPNTETGFDPKEINLLDIENFAKISPNLYRVQKLSRLTYGNSIVREYVFRHHLETTVSDVKDLKEVTYKRLQSLSPINTIVKVRINHLGKIIQTGEL